MRPTPRGAVLEVTPQSAGWSHVGLQGRRSWSPARRFEGGEAIREILPGGDERQGGGHRRPTRRSASIGGRASVFEDAAPGVGLRARPARPTASRRRPPWSSPSARPRPSAACRRLIASGDMSRECAGRAPTPAIVRNILPETDPAESLLVVEVITPGGHWSSYPPHKHDTATRRRGNRAGRDLLPPAEPAAGLRLPARLHRRPQPGRDRLRSRTATW